MAQGGRSLSRWAVTAGLVWLAALWAVALASTRIAPWLKGPHAWPYDLAQRVTPLARWDSGWYVSIAEAGYQGVPWWPAEETNHAFFPLYPLLMRLLVRTTGVETTLAGNIVSALCTVAALPFFAAWVERRWGRWRAKCAVLLMLAFPTAFFFGAVYTEGLFLLLAMLALTAIDLEKPRLAILSGVLAGLTRITSMAIAPLLFLLAYQKRRSDGASVSQALKRAALVGLTPVLGFALFCLYFQWKFGDPFLFVRSQHSWAKEDKSILTGPRLILRDVKRDIKSGKVLRNSPARTLEGVYLLLFGGLAAALAAKRRWAESLYIAGILGMVVLTGTLESSGRYVLPAFPGFVALAGLARDRAHLKALVGVSAALQACYVWAFVHWFWAG